jgi:hypothetical protein
MIELPRKAQFWCRSKYIDVSFTRQLPRRKKPTSFSKEKIMKKIFPLLLLFSGYCVAVEPVYPVFKYADGYATKKAINAMVANGWIIEEVSSYDSTFVAYKSIVSSHS